MSEDREDTQPATEPMAKATLRLPERIWHKVRGAAGAEGKSANQYLEELICRVLGEPPPPPPQKGRKGGAYQPNLRTASSLCDRPG